LIIIHILCYFRYILWSVYNTERQIMKKDITQKKDDHHHKGYPELEPLDPPKFNDAVPEYLLTVNDEQFRKYQVQQMSLISQQNEWLMTVGKDTNEHCRRTNGRVTSLEKWKDTLDINEIIPTLKLVQRVRSFWTISVVLFGGISAALGIVLGILKLIHS